MRTRHSLAQSALLPLCCFSPEPKRLTKAKDRPVCWILGSRDWWSNFLLNIWTQSSVQCKPHQMWGNYKDIYVWQLLHKPDTDGLARKKKTIRSLGERNLNFDRYEDLLTHRVRCLFYLSIVWFQLLQAHTWWITSPKTLVGMMAYLWLIWNKESDSYPGKTADLWENAAKLLIPSFLSFDPTYSLALAARRWWVGPRLRRRTGNWVIWE